MAKKEKELKKKTPRRILIFFISIVGVFTIYQFFVGNPFFDEFPPAWVYLIFEAIAVLLLIKNIRDSKRNSPED